MPSTRPARAGATAGGSGQKGPPAAHLPVARVAVDMPLAHLDRPFDYLVPERVAGAAGPGVRVRVRFAGQLTGGYLLERLAESDHPGRLAYLERVVSPEPVLTPQIAALAREVADRYAGTLADVLRLAIPPRHAAVEAGQRDRRPADGPQPRPARPPAPGAGSWDRYPAGKAFLTALAAGRAPRAVWSALPGSSWAEEIARAAGTAAAAGRGALVVVPDARDLAAVDTALGGVLGPGRHVCLSAGLGPAERYRRWLAVARGAVRVVAGTRAAMFAPVHDLGLVVIWDDGDDLHAERRAPYPHAREVLALRAHRGRAAALIGGFARTAEATSLIGSGWAVALTASRPVIRGQVPRVQATGQDAELAQDPAARSARMPSLALRTAREGLVRGPVLVQVPRRGYLAAVACEECRTPARCPACGGPLAVAAAGAPARCRWCGRTSADRPGADRTGADRLGADLAGADRPGADLAGLGWHCPVCGCPRMRAVLTGARRTAEELQRAFPGTRVVTSGGSSVVAAVPGVPALVVATPGAEPRADGGYAAAVLLDGWVLLGRPSLDAAQETLRRWLNAAALVVPASAGGAVAVVAEASLATVQALIRWDPVTHAERDLAQRGALRFPPAVRMASVTGPAAAVGQFLAEAVLPGDAEVLGPVDTAPWGEPAQDDGQGTVRALIRVSRSRGLALAAALRDTQAARSARKETFTVRVQMDPAELV